MCHKTIIFFFLRYFRDTKFRALHLGYKIEFVEGMDFYDEGFFPTVFTDYNLMTIARV